MQTSFCDCAARVQNRDRDDIFWLINFYQLIRVYWYISHPYLQYLKSIDMEN